MAGTTTRYGLPYKEINDIPDGADLSQDLSLAVETSLGTVDDRVVLNEAALTRLQTPTARVISSSNSSAVNSETVLQTVPSTVYKANRAYEITVGGGFVLSAAAAFASFSIRKTNAAGTLLITFLRVEGANTTLDHHLNLRAFFIVGASDVTATLVLTGTANGANTVQHTGTGSMPRHVTVRDVGPSSAWSGFPTLS